MNDAIFLLRCLQLGLTLEDLPLLTVGMVLDLATEQGNDSYEYPLKATQENFDKF